MTRIPQLCPQRTIVTAHQEITTIQGLLLGHSPTLVTTLSLWPGDNLIVDLDLTVVPSSEAEARRGSDCLSRHYSRVTHKKRHEASSIPALDPWIHCRSFLPTLKLQVPPPSCRIQQQLPRRQRQPFSNYPSLHRESFSCAWTDPKTSMPCPQQANGKWTRFGNGSTMSPSSLSPSSQAQAGPSPQAQI